MLFWAGIVRHSLSANQIVKCFKLKNLKKDIRYQVDFLLPLKLEETCCFGLWPQNTLGLSVCKIFYFWLVWIFKFNTGGPLLHCTCYMWEISFKIINKHYLNLIQKACVMVVVIRTKTQWIMLEATIWFQVVYSQEIYLAVFLLQW